MRRSHILILTSAILSAGFVFTAACGGGGDSRRNLNTAECRNGEITVYGEAPLLTSVATSRQKAKTDACRRAVEKCIGEEVASASGVMDGQSIGNEIFSQAKGVCRDDEIIEESQYTLDTITMFKVFMRFRVSQAEIESSIDTMKELVGNPKVMILIREEYTLPGGGKRIVGFSSRQAKSVPLLSDFLQQKGYTIVPSAGVAARIGNQEFVAENPAALDDSIKDLAAEAGADVLIVGRIQTFPQQIATTGPFKSCEVQGQIQVLALWGDGRELGNYTDRGAGVQTTDLGAALQGVEWFTVGKTPERSVDGLAYWMHNRLQNEWAIMTRNNPIKLTITNITDRERGVFMDNLKEATAVRKVDERSFSNETAIFDIQYPGRAFALADTLGWYGDNPNVFSVLEINCKNITVSEVKRGEITLNMTGNGCGG